MATLIARKSGSRLIQFCNRHGKRETVSLGARYLEKDARRIQFYIEDLADARKRLQEPEANTAQWLDSIAKDDAELFEKLQRVGLAGSPRPSPAAAATYDDTTLKGFATAYIKNRHDVKSGTRVNLDLARDRLVEFFGDDAELTDITTAHAIDFRHWLKGKCGMAENTARRVCGRARQFFKAALRRKLIDENPFVDREIPVKVMGNESRQQFITRGEAERVLKACPSTRWRLIFALARFGGLRVPSELVGLKWGDVNWELNRFTVYSPKTEHHEGHESRLVPIFPELRPHLQMAYDELLEDFDPKAQRLSEQPIIANCHGKKNLATHLKRIICKAGLNPWKKPFQNLRSTRETELSETFPAHVVCKWLGNSEAVAKEHYLQLTEEHFERAAAPQRAAVSAAIDVAGTCHEDAAEQSPNAGNTWQPQSDEKLPPKDSNLE